MFKRKKDGHKLDGPLTTESLNQWLVTHLAKRLDICPTAIDTQKSFESYGIDSRVAVQISGSLEKVVERPLSPGLLYEHQTIDDLISYLTKELQLAERSTQWE